MGIIFGLIIPRCSEFALDWLKILTRTKANDDNLLTFILVGADANESSCLHTARRAGESTSCKLPAWTRTVAAGWTFRHESRNQEHCLARYSFAQLHGSIPAEA